MKLLRHERDKIGDFQKRALLHIPMGFLIVLTVLVHWALPLLITWLFVRYEENEDLHTKDQAWKDYFGAIIGAFVATFGIVVFKLIMAAITRV